MGCHRDGGRAERARRPATHHRCTSHTVTHLFAVAQRTHQHVRLNPRAHLAIVGGSISARQETQHDQSWADTSTTAAQSPVLNGGGLRRRLASACRSPHGRQLTDNPPTTHRQPTMYHLPNGAVRSGEVARRPAAHRWKAQDELCPLMAMLPACLPPALISPQRNQNSSFLGCSSLYGSNPCTSY